MPAQPYWTFAQDQIIRQMFLTESRDDILDAVNACGPLRNWSGVCHRAYRLTVVGRPRSGGRVSKRGWTEEELAILRAHYASGRTNWPLLLRLLPKRTKNSIVQRANKPDIALGGLKHPLGAAHRAWTGTDVIPGRFWSKLERMAEKRGIDVRLDIWEATDLFKAQCGRCALTELPLVFGPDGPTTTASLDRIDSDGDYVLGNVMWVHKVVNLMKGCLSLEEFRQWCRLAADGGSLEATAQPTGSWFGTTGKAA